MVRGMTVDSKCSPDEGTRDVTELPYVIYLTHRVPYPPDKGDRIRTFHILRYLASRSRVLLGCLADEPVVEDHVRLLRELCADVCVVDNASIRRWVRGGGSFLRGQTISEGLFYHPKLQQRLSRWLAEFPVQSCLLSASSLAPYLHDSQMAKLNSATVVDLIDVDSQKWLDYAGVFRGWKRWVYRHEGERLRKLEIELARRVQALTVVSESECGLFRSFCQEGQLLAIPNGVDLEYFTPRSATIVPTSCVFVGAMDYPPNVDAVVWFAEHVWPEIIQRQPQATFTIVGRRPTEVVQDLGKRTGIQVTGQVADVREYVAQSAVVVAPLRIARGIQNKVLEALAMAKPVLASTAAREGLAVTEGQELLRADTPEEWKRTLLDLWESPKRQTELGAAGRRYVEQHHSWESCLKDFSRLLNLTSNSPPR